MADLHIAPGLDLPAATAAAQTFAIIARRGAGKTHTALVVAEEMIAAGIQVVALDPTGAWWGIRSSADGKKVGLPVTILGGDHGDLPLEPTAGKVIADLVIEHPGSVIIDLSAFESNAAQDRFVADFTERLYRGKAKDHRPLHLMADEADSFAPQKPQRGQERMLGAFEAIVRRGRSRGLGVTLITQRPASLNKNVLTQTECLVVLQVTGPQDRKAIDAWIQGNGTREERGEVLGSLASLRQGEAWFWSPGWLRTLVRVQVRRRKTFDSSRTPEAGHVAVVPTKLAPVDLDALREAMAATIEQAKAADPKELTRRIRALEKELAARSEVPVVSDPEVVEVRVEVPVVPDGVLDALNDIDGTIRDCRKNLTEIFDAFNTEIEAAVRAVVTHADEPRELHPIRHTPESLAAVERAKERTRKARVPVSPNDPVPVKVGTITFYDFDHTKITGGARRMLVALSRFPAGMTDAQVATQAKLKKSGGTFSTYVSRLTSSGLAVRPARGQLQITAAGMEFIGAEGNEGLSGEALRDDWRAKFTGGCRRMYDVLVYAYPEPVSRDRLSDLTNIAQSGGTFGTYLSRLRTNGLITVEGEHVRADDTLFLEA